MKGKVFLIILMLLPLALAAQTPKKVEINIVDKEYKVSEMAKSLLKSSFTKAFAEASEFEVIDRQADMSRIMNDSDFQRTGEAGDSQAKKLGEMPKADLMLTVEVKVLGESNLLISAKMMDLETAMAVAMVSPQIVGSSPKDLQDASKQIYGKILEQMKN